MGTDAAEDVGTLPSSYDIKVHRLMCTELIKLVNRVSKILPEIEAARPRCSSGIETLCLLSSAIDKAKLLLQHCSEASKLYLALTGDVILSRCKKSRNLLHQSLSEIQNMVPVLLSAEINRVISDIGKARFSLDPPELEAGRVVRELLHQYGSASDSVEEVAFKAIQVAALRLHITSQKAILIEKRSIKKVLDKLDKNDQGKRKILLFFLNLLNKYGKAIVEEQKQNGFVRLEDHFSHSNSCVQSAEVESSVKHGLQEVHVDISKQSAPPDEFKCPLSFRLMYDPVVIASGQTFERMWIQKWFDEGHDTCPKTGTKLSHLSVTPNASMKDLILKWCTAHRVTIPDPSLQATNYSLDTSSTSIASLSSSLNDLALPIDFSNLSLGSSDASHTSETTQAKTIYGLNKTSTNAGDGSIRFHSGANAHEVDLDYLSKLDSLPWESQFSVVENIEKLLKYDNQDLEFIPYQDLIQEVMRFLKRAHDLHDVKAQKNGCLLLLAFIKNCRKSISHIDSDAYDLLASLIDIEVAKEAVSLLESLSYHEQARHKIAESGAVAPLLRILDSRTRESQEPVLNILCNLSGDSEARSLLLPSDIIPKLVPYLEDTSLAGYCVTILENMSYKEDARVSIAETDGCIASLVKLLESDSRENQEHAVAVLLFLCSQRVQYCQLVMDEGVIPGLFTVSVKGNNKAKSMAMELLRVLRDEVDDIGECSGSDLQVSTDSSSTSKERKSSSKASRIVWKIPIFSKPTGRRKG